MSHKFIFNASFHLFLIKVDNDLARCVQESHCPYCGGELHQSNYPRSPVGVPIHLREHYINRISFCCADCRRRVTPLSTRFIYRRWHPAPFFILICAITLGINERRLKQIKTYFGITVSESTWKRWRRWWREQFVATNFWQQAQGYIKAGIINAPLPRGLLKIFTGKLAQKLILFLQFLSPLPNDFTHYLLYKKFPQSMPL